MDTNDDAHELQENTTLTHVRNPVGPTLQQGTVEGGYDTGALCGVRAKQERVGEEDSEGGERVSGEEEREEDGGDEGGVGGDREEGGE